MGEVIFSTLMTLNRTVDMSITNEDVVAAYRLFLQREPESEEAVASWLASTSSLDQLREGFLRSEEYSQKNFTLKPSMTGLEPPIRAQMDSELNQGEIEALFTEVKKTWTHLGKEDPYWAVLSSDEFHGWENVKAIERFYASGANDLALIINTLERNGVTLPQDAIVVEYGCGLGRVTRHLASQYHSVIGIDISKTMLDAAGLYIQAHGIQNTTLKLLESPEDISNLPVCDMFFSLIVLQHSPPPIISLIVRNAIKHLNFGGVALFQVPTYIPNYDFRASDCISGCTNDAFKPQHKQYDVHAIRQKDLFRLIHDTGGVLLEVIENTMLGPIFPGSMSNTLLVQKIH